MQTLSEVLTDYQRHLLCVQAAALAFQENPTTENLTLWVNLQEPDDNDS